MFPQVTDEEPGAPHRPSRSATADRPAPSANRSKALTYIKFRLLSRPLFEGGAKTPLSRGAVLDSVQDSDIVAPGQFCNELLQNLLVGPSLGQRTHVAEVPRAEPFDSRKLSWAIANQKAGHPLGLAGPSLYNASSPAPSRTAASSTVRSGTLVSARLLQSHLRHRFIPDHRHRLGQCHRNGHAQRPCLHPRRRQIAFLPRRSSTRCRAWQVTSVACHSFASSWFIPKNGTGTSCGKSNIRNISLASYPEVVYKRFARARPDI